MATRTWSSEQLDAINARGGTLLVSAAAGSGKTSVLTHRVIRRITDPVNPCDIDKLLIVTFTRAATAEMRERIAAELAALLALNPHDRRLIRQQMLLYKAKICTIDALCGDLVREHFHRLPIQPNYRVLDANELTVLQDEAMQALMEAYYRQGDPAFSALVELVGNARDDAGLCRKILDLHTLCGAHPFPEQLLAAFCQKYDPQASLPDSAWEPILRRHLKESLAYAAQQLGEALRALREDATLENAYAPSLRKGRADIERLLIEAERGDWDALRLSVTAFGFEKFSPVRGYQGDALKAAVTARRDTVQKLLKKLGEVLCCSEEEYREDIAVLRPLVDKLAEMVRDFGARLRGMLRERNAATFTEITHLCLRLLAQEGEGGVAPTPLAQELSAQYEEILIDEYQDINAAQDLIFRCLSRDGTNLFMVGDVKQSIYGFRQAMPELFLQKREAYRPYGGRFPAKIQLGANYRSRRGVTAHVNFFFRQLMSRETGDIDYNDAEALLARAHYPAREGADAELHIVKKEGKPEGILDDYYEGLYIAEQIKKMIAGGLSIQEGSQTRPAAYRDFCILLRNAKGRVGEVAKALESQGIPVFAEVQDGFFARVEITAMLAILRVIDNPLQDLPLLTAMLSPLFGFTHDDVAHFKLRDKSQKLLQGIQAMAGEGDAKCRAMLDRLSHFRRLSAVLPADELIRRIYEETDFPALVQAMPGGEGRKNNLHLLVAYARDYEEAGCQGLSGFIRFIDRLQHQQSDLAAATALPESADVVRVMSIHKSKGLEFPVCILAGLSTAFHATDRRGKMLLHPDLGVGMMRQEPESLREFVTLPQRAIAIALEARAMAEELRVLYVGMTRAKEKLLLLTTLSGLEKKLASMAVTGEAGKPLPPFWVRSAGSYSDWILAAALCHPDALILRQLAGVDRDITFPCTEPLAITVAEEIPAAAPAAPEAAADIPADAGLLVQIGARMAQPASSGLLKGILAKRIASDFAVEGFNRERIAASRPAFLCEEGLTPAQIGTALHKFMQHNEWTASLRDLAAERDRLVRAGFLSAEEGAVLPLSKLHIFFQSELFARMRRSANCMREIQFTVEIPLAELIEALPVQLEQEGILVQGMADCAFEEDGALVIVDYKTDRVHAAAQLIRKYAPQLRVYAQALTQVTGLPVKSCYLYSFAMEQEILLRDE